MKEIPLTYGFAATVDDVDYESVCGFAWRTLRREHTNYAVRSVRINGAKVSVYMHRLILDAPRHLFVDHRNGNGLDNRRENIRPCTRQQNAWNKRGKGRRLKGAYFSVRRGVFDSVITANGKRYPLGAFETEIEAALAYDTAAKQFFGEFACLNFPNEHVLPPLEKEDGRCSTIQIGVAVTP